MRILTIVTLIALFTANSAIAKQAEPLMTLAKMKINEVTVFKDGHTFILHKGKMPTNSSGNIVMDYLPAPVLGTYWPYSADKNAELRTVTASRKKVLVRKTALSIREIVEANIGARVIVTEQPSSSNAQFSPKPYEAKIIEIPTRTGEELEALNASSSDERLPEKGNIVMLKTGKGFKMIEFDRILDITFVDTPKSKVSEEEFRNLLTLDLKWKGKPRHEADVGMIYLQRGIRWIPGYKIDINDKGKAVLNLEATLINELTDINDVTVHLVIGVPSFAFKDSVDPISLRQDIARLSSSFRQETQTAFGFSNAIMSQQASPVASRRIEMQEMAGIMDPGPELGGEQKSEDLFMFTINHVTLKKGERIVMPVSEYELSYEDVYTLDIPFTPPPEILQTIGHSQRADLMRIHFSPKVKHKIRIKNKTGHPFTTAPVMITKDSRIIAQGMMTYTPVGGDVSVELTTAVDISVTKVDNETKRTPNAINWNRNNYSRIDLEGKITLINYKKEPITIEITRHVLGNVDTVGQKGKKEMINPFEDNTFLPDARISTWWYGYSWPWWWYRFNGIGRINWVITLDSMDSAEHTYSWHYFWN